MSKMKRERKRINAFDVVIILLILSLVVTFGYRVYRGVEDKGTQVGMKYIMHFECESVYSSLLDYLENGDALYLASDGKLLGYLYAEEDDERGAVYEIIDDIPTFADEEGMLQSETGSESGTEDNIDPENIESESDTSNIEKNIPKAERYDMIKIGGQIRLNIKTVRVHNGDYYSIGGTNFTEGSVIKVYTDDTEFTILVTDIAIAE